MAGRRKPRYPEALNRPIVRPPGLLNEAGSTIGDRYIEDLLRGGIDLLFKHYGIGATDPQRWQKLAICLALDHVPGMQVVDSPGAKRGRKKRGVESDREFVQRIEQIAGQRQIAKRLNKKSIKEAIGDAVARGELKGSEKYLINRYYTSKKRLREIGELRRRLLSLAELAERLRSPEK